MRVHRIASHRFELAKTSFYRGDHLSARRHSSKAKEIWKCVDAMNAEAAEKIYLSNNKRNDVWRLDLHGLHARESISKLQEHLLKIEGQENKKAFDKETNIA